MEKIKRLLVFGSRTIKDPKIFIPVIKLYNDFDLIVTSEKTAGIDELARKYSLRVLKKKPKTFRAMWHLYGKRAAYIRNRQMVLYCTEAVGIWNGYSEGTSMTIKLLKQYNKPFKIFDENLNIIEESESYGNEITAKL